VPPLNVPAESASEELALFFVAPQPGDLLLVLPKFEWDIFLGLDLTDLSTGLFLTGTVLPSGEVVEFVKFAASLSASKLDTAVVARVDDFRLPRRWLFDLVLLLADLRHGLAQSRMLDLVFIISPIDFRIQIPLPFFSLRLASIEVVTLGLGSGWLSHIRLFIVNMMVSLWLPEGCRRVVIMIMVVDVSVHASFLSIYRTLSSTHASRTQD
jgi:hypothetical protein